MTPLSLLDYILVSVLLIIVSEESEQEILRSDRKKKDNDREEYVNITSKKWKTKIFFQRKSNYSLDVLIGRRKLT